MLIHAYIDAIPRLVIHVDRRRSAAMKEDLVVTSVSNTTIVAITARRSKLRTSDILWTANEKRQLGS